MLQVCTTTLGAVNADVQRVATFGLCETARMDQKKTIRDWMKAVLAATGWSAARWAAEAGTSPTNITRMINNAEKASIPRYDTLTKLADAVPGDAGVSSPFSSGAPAAAPAMPEPTLIPVGLEPVTVLGEVQAGAWVEAWQWPEGEQWAFPTPRRGKYQDVPKFALEVKGPSMDLVYPEGSILICVEWWRVGRAPRTGERVIVERVRAGLHEATVKEIEILADGAIRLWPRSSHPRHQTPIDLPRDGLPWGLAEGAASFVAGPGLEDQHDEVVLKALVVGAFRSEP